MSDHPFRDNFTRIPNFMFDEVMPLCSPNAWKVTCAVTRATWGWEDNSTLTGRKMEDELSYSQIRTRTGINSSHTISKAIQECLVLGLLDRRQKGKTPRSGFLYRIHPEIVENVHLCRKCTSASAETAPQLVQKMHTQKKERNIKESTAEKKRDKKALDALKDKLSQVTGADFKLQAPYINKTAVRLLDAGYTPQDVDTWLTTVHFKDEWSRANKSAPTLSQVVNGIGQIRLESPQANGRVPRPGPALEIRS